MMNWLRKLMYGRYGVDQLSIALLTVCLLLSLLSPVFSSTILSIVSFICLVVCYFRIFSKNLTKRRVENLWFLKKWNPIKRKLVLLKSRWTDRKTHRYYKCPQCSQTVRVPKGKGNIRITCPKCFHDFHKHT